MSRWTGAMIVSDAHVYEVEADSYEEAQQKIVALFAAGEPADYLQEMECYTENIREEKD
tara:strand:+ start:68 stop:244 length:177 start_codon:yes stop_codon:yes gene_type:complete